MLNHAINIQVRQCLRGSTPTCKHVWEVRRIVQWLIMRVRENLFFFFLFFGSTACARCDTTGKKGHEESGKSKPNFIKSLLLFIHGVEWCLSAIYHWVHKCTRWKATPIFISPIHPLSFLPTPTHRPTLNGLRLWLEIVHFFPYSSSLFYDVVQGLSANAPYAWPIS